MAGIKATATSGVVATSTSAKTILQLVAASNHRALLKALSISFAGISNTAEPIKVDLVVQSTAGTGGDAVTLTKVVSGDDETLQTTAQKDIDGGEPTGSTILHSFYVHPQGGLEWQAPFGGEFVIQGGARLGVRTTAAASVSCIATALIEE